MAFDTPISWITALFANKKVRFMAGGALNTLVDFISFNILIFAFGASFWVANIVSTSIAMVLSFIINKQAIFKDKGGFRHTQALAFVVVTAAGLWGMQTIAVVGISDALRPVAHLVLDGTRFAADISWLVPNVSKTLSIVLSAVWNYLWYDRVIFAHTPKTAAELNEWM